MTQIVRRGAINFFVDAASLLAMMGLIVTGMIVRYVLPAGSGGFRHRANRTLWGLSRHEWGDLHFWTAAALGVLVTLHLALHWSWVCHFIRQRIHNDRPDAPIPTWKRHVYGFGFLILVVGIISGFLVLAEYNSVAE